LFLVLVELGVRFTTRWHFDLAQFKNGAEQLPFFLIALTMIPFGQESGTQLIQK